MAEIETEVSAADLATADVLTSTHEAWLQQMVVTGKVGEAWRCALERGEPAAASLDEEVNGPWRGRVGQTMAARLLSIMGDERRSSAMHLRNFRRHPEDPQACFFACFRILGRFGPLRALRTAREIIARRPDVESDAECADLWTFLAEIYGQFRDFERAHTCLDHAKACLADEAWLQVCKASLLLREDRGDESVALAAAALKKFPRYRSLVGTVADHHWMQNRDEEAIALLVEAHEATEHPDYSGQLIGFYDESEQLEKGLEAVDLFEQRSIRADKKTRKWIAGYRASLLYQLGRGEEMLPFAKKSKHGFYKRIAKRVRKGIFAKGKRVRLAVPFIRQSAMTCAPATLTALSNFHDREADHLGVAEAICYDGTSDYNERRWAEEQGWIVREFRADWPTTQALVDRGLPYSVATVEATSAHLQAIVGYDSRAGTIIIRDPGNRHYSEWMHKHFFKHYAHCGPRALLMVPPEQKDKLDGIDLPDAELYDICHQINHALETHHRPSAAELQQKLGEAAPDHRLVHHTAALLANYDDDTRAQMKVYEAMIEQFPKVERFRFYHYFRRANFVSREQQIEFLRDRLSRKRKKIFVLYFKEIADLLAEDSRELDEALYRYRRALHYRPLDADVLYGQAGVLWSLRHFEDATELYRFAACLADKTEHHSTSYFQACRQIRKTEAGLAMLQQRFEKYSHQNSGPAMSLCNALRDLDRDEEVFPLIETALEKLPDDGDFMVYAANQYASFGSRDRARELLAAAQGKANPAQLLQLEANIEARSSQPKLALDAWRRLAFNDPLHMGAHGNIARLLAMLEPEGDEAAIAYLEETCAQFPHHVPLHELLISWLRDEAPGRAESTLRHLIENQPANAWAWRELAIDLSEQNRPDDAVEVARHSAELQPNNSWSYSTLGLAHEQRRDYTAAADAFRRTIELNVDNHVGLSGLVRVSPDSAAKREALTFIEKQLASQVLRGETLHTFQQVAWSVVDSDELLAALQRANEARPDLWETWSVLGDQLVSMGRPEEALKITEESVARFPMMPRGYYDLGFVHRELGNTEAEIAAFEKCLEFNPQWDRPLRALAVAREKLGDTDTAIELLRKAVAENPGEPANHGCLADLLWRLAEHDAAFDALVAAVRAAPNYGWGWSTIGDWARILDRKNEAIAEGERLVEERPTEPESWLILARLHGKFDDSADQLDALERGLALHPGHDQLHDKKAWALCAAGRFDEAIEACSPAHWQDEERPKTIAAREAWIENQRGNRDLAIGRMQAVSAAHSDYYWAHECLADWYQEAERYDEALETCRHMVRLEPASPEPQGCLGDLHLAREEKAEAIECFSRAFEIAPSYSFAGYQLVRLRIEKGALDEARNALETLEYHNPHDPAVARMRVWLESDSKDRDRALEAFRHLCTLDSVAAATLDAAESDLVGCGHAPRIVEVYYQALSDGTARSTSVAQRWPIMRLSGDWRRTVKELKALGLEGEMAETAWRELIYELERSDRANIALHVIRKNREQFLASTLLWGSVGYVMHSAGKYRQATKWMADYREREQVQPWMLQNLAEATRETGGFAPCAEVYSWAADNLPTGHDSWTLHARAGYFLAVTARGEKADDQLSRARHHLSYAVQGHLDDLDRYVVHLGEYLLTEKSDTDQLSAHLSAATDTLSKWATQNYARNLMRRALLKNAPGLIPVGKGSLKLLLRSFWPW
jgi:tetratricopeptide (TPR) repeat protein